MEVEKSKAKILIVDDTPQNLFTLEKVLKELDVEVIQAASGNEALKATLYHDFSLIMLDVHMPGMNGLEVAEVLKQTDNTADIPIIFVTAMDKDESFELRAYSKGAVDFLYKPFNKVVLLSKAKVLLDLYMMKKGIDEILFRQSTEKPRVLVVDDNPENILVLRKLLNKLDVDVITASSGNEALTETLYNDFAVIFLDVQMPGMDGYEVAELLKTNEKTAGIPIIFITAIDRDDAKEIKGYGKGAVDFIFKPFNEFILLSKAKIFLDIYKMRAGLEELIAERTSALRDSNKRLREEIHRKEKVESELLQTRSYLSSVINSISSVLIGTDTSGQIIDMNIEAARVSGISPEQAQGKKLEEIFPFYSAIAQEIMELSDSDAPIEKTSIPIKINGFDTINDFTVYPLIGEDSGKVVIRVDDVTASRQMEEELHNRRHIDSLGQLAGGIAHDFNNMLTAIMGSAELLRLKAGDDRGLQKPIESIVVAVERAADLTGKLLSFARKKGGEKTAVDIHRIIKETVSILRRSIDKRIQIVVEDSVDQNIVEGDISELSNALLNLGINARDAMPEGGVLTISSKIRHINNVTAQSKDLKQGRYVELCITDTGCGMTDQIKKRIFEPFFTTKAQGKGTGLGLASVYGTVKAHDGAITLESSPGAGSTFTLLLPLSNKTAPVEVDLDNQLTDKELNGTILLVDDEESVRNIGTDLLAEIGMDVITAKNGYQAIDMVREHKSKISLILLDMIMPKLNGQDCFREIRKIWPEAKVVICSGYAPDETVTRLRQEGVLGIIRKPFRFSELRNVIHKYLDRPAS